MPTRDRAKYDLENLEFLFVTCVIRCVNIGSCKEPSKRPKGGSSESDEEPESNPTLSECFDFLVFIH